MSLLTKSFQLAGKALGKTTSAISNNISDSFFNGQYVRHARSVGITNPYTLAKMDGSRASRRAIINQVKRDYNGSQESWNKQFKMINGTKDSPGVFRQLNTATRNARIKTAVGVGTAVYAKNKFSSKIDDIKTRAQYPYAYSYQ